MRNLLIVIVFGILFFQGCNSSQADNKAEKSVKQESVNAVAVSQVNSNEGGSVKLTKDIFLKQVWNYQSSPKTWNYLGDKPAIIDFYADWCAPCRIASPILEEISHEYAGEIYVYKIDTQVEQELAAVFGISGIPAFLYIPLNGKPVMMSGIARTKEDTKKMFTDNIDKYLLTSN
jgi:thioredoxin 1